MDGVPNPFADDPFADIKPKEDPSTPPAPEAVPAPEPVQEVAQETVSLAEESGEEEKEHPEEPPRRGIVYHPPPGSDADQPPHDDDAERAVLGSILLENEAMSLVAPIVSHEDFLSPAHALIFRTMQAMIDDGFSIDAVSLRSRLTQTADIDKIGGPEAIVALMDACPSAANAEHYAQIVRDTSIRRYGLRLVRRAETVLKEYGKESAEQIVTRLSRGLETAIERRSEVPPAMDLNAVMAEEDEPVDALVGDDLLSVGHYFLLAGSPKLGKSLVAMELALRLAHGSGSWMEQTIRREGRTLILSAEGGNKLLKKRVAKMMISYTPDELGRVVVPKPCPKLNLKDPGSIILLQRMIKEYRVDLVVIDPLVRFVTIEDENDNAEAMTILKYLADVRERTKCAMVIVHHTTKSAKESGRRGGNQARGAGVWFSEADLALTLLPPDSEKSEGFVAVWDSRWADKPAGVYVERDETLHHLCTDIAKSKANEHREAITIADIRTVLGKAQLTRRQIAMALDTSESSVRRRIKEAGDTICSGRSRGNERLYWNPGYGPSEETNGEDEQTEGDGGGTGVGLFPQG